MANEIQGIQLAAGGEAVRFGIKVDGNHTFCLVSREVLEDLSRVDSTEQDQDLLTEFSKHVNLIAKKVIQAIRSGMTGDPLLLPAELFFGARKAKRSPKI